MCLPQFSLLSQNSGSTFKSYLNFPLNMYLLIFFFSNSLQNFFNSNVMESVRDKFCIYHVVAPGQEVGAVDLSDSGYPSMSELSEQVEYIMHHYGISVSACLGVGLGANVLARLARRRPKMINGLISVNCDSQSAGWMEWLYTKISLNSLKIAKIRASVAW